MVFSPRSRGKAFAVFGAVVGLAAIAGPLAGNRAGHGRPVPVRLPAGAGPPGEMAVYEVRRIGDRSQQGDFHGFAQHRNHSASIDLPGVCACIRHRPPHGRDRVRSRQRDVSTRRGRCLRSCTHLAGAPDGHAGDLNPGVRRLAQGWSGTGSPSHSSGSDASTNQRATSTSVDECATIDAATTSAAR